MTTGWPGASAACRSPTTLLVGVALRLLGLHLEAHRVNLLSLNSQALEELFTGLLVTTESAETGPIGVLLPAVDAESHAPSSKVTS